MFLIFTPQGFTAPSLDVSLLKNKLQTGETTELKIEIRWPKAEASYTYGVPDIPLQNLTVTNQAESQETFLKDNAEWSLKTFTYELTPKGSGEGEMGGFNIIYVNPADGSQGQFQVSPLKIQISKPKPKQNILPAAIVLVAGLGLVGGFLWAKSRGKRAAAGQPQTSPQEIAFSVIKTKIQSASASSENVLSEIYKEFREFLKEAYGFTAGQISESEILNALKQKNAAPEELRTVEKLLDQIREAKFTGKKLTETELQMLKKEMTSFMDGKQIHSFSSPN